MRGPRGITHKKNLLLVNSTLQSNQPHLYFCPCAPSQCRAHRIIHVGNGECEGVRQSAISVFLREFFLLEDFVPSSRLLYILREKPDVVRQQQFEYQPGSLDAWMVTPEHMSSSPEPRWMICGWPAALWSCTPCFPVVAAGGRESQHTHTLNQPHHPQAARGRG